MIWETIKNRTIVSHHRFSIPKEMDSINVGDLVEVEMQPRFDDDETINVGERRVKSGRRVHVGEDVLGPRGISEGDSVDIINLRKVTVGGKDQED